MLRFLTQKLRHQTLNEICPLPPTNETTPSSATSDSLACEYDNDHEDDDDDDADADKNGNVLLETSWSAAALSVAAAAADCARLEQHRRLIVSELDDVEAESIGHQPSLVTSSCIAGTMMATDHGRELERRTYVMQLPAADVATQAPNISEDVGSKSRAKRKRPKLGRGAAAGSGGCCGSSAVVAVATDSAAAAALATVTSASVVTAITSSGNSGSRYCSSDSSSDEEVVELLSGRRAAARPVVAYGDAAAAGATPTLATDSTTCIADDDACCCCRKSTSELDADEAAELGSHAGPVVGSKAAVAPAAGGGCCDCGFGRVQSDMPPWSSLASGPCTTEAAAAAAPASSGGALMLTHGTSIAVSPRKRPHCAAAAGQAVDVGLRLLRPVLRQQRQQQQQLQQQPVEEDDIRSYRNVVVANNAGTVLVSRPSLDLEKMHQKAAAFKRHYPRTIRIRCWNGGSNAGSCPMPEPLRPPSDFLFRSLDTVLVPGSHLTPVERPSACSV